MMNQRVKTLAAAFALPTAVVLAVVGCSRTTEGTAVADPPASTATSAAGTPASASPSASGSCAPVTGRLLTLTPKSPREPKLGLPQPAGWERERSQDSAVIRGALVNKSLAEKSFAPTAVITMENGRGMSAQQALQSQTDVLKAGLNPIGLVSTPGTLCGYPMATLNYTMPGGATHKVTTIAVSVPDGPNMWSITVTVQTKAPDNPTYRRDSQEILSGLQITK